MAKIRSIKTCGKHGFSGEIRTRVLCRESIFNQPSFRLSTKTQLADFTLLGEAVARVQGKASFTICGWDITPLITTHAREGTWVTFGFLI